MTNEPMTITCAQVDDLLPDYFEETLEAASRKLMDEHLASCLRCSAIIRDVNNIRAEAARLPEIAPSRNLWRGISERIEPTVRPIGARPTRELGRRWVPFAAAAAAGLVVATSGVTYLATTRSLRSEPARVAAVPVVTAGTATSVTPAPAATSPATNNSDERANAREPSRPARESAGLASLASRSTARAASSSEIAYGEEIQRLQRIITQRKSELDPATVAIVEQNLKIIDAAVKQSRAALARDPKSGFLTDQLNNVLDKKVNLLRTVALLPSTT